MPKGGDMVFDRDVARLLLGAVIQGEFHSMTGDRPPSQDAASVQSIADVVWQTFSVHGGNRAEMIQTVRAAISSYRAGRLAEYLNAQDRTR